MTERPTTPISSPKVQVPIKLTEPSTPPSEKKFNRLSSFLTTPDQSLDNLPYSPSLKRPNESSKLNSHNILSPYHSNLLKTPRHSGYESDENDSNKLKMQKTPMFFSPGKKLFDNEAKEKEREELKEITYQLKGKLSHAIDKLQKQQKFNKGSYKFNFTELNFSSESSPTKKLKSSLQRDLSKPQTESLNKANFNLQSLTNENTNLSQDLSSPNSLKTSPFIAEKRERVINIPSPDEETSAHNALMATLSRQQHTSKSHKSKTKNLRPLSLDASYKLPPLNVAVAESANGFKFGAGSEMKPKKEQNEQDAVFSLMSLSSPQSNKFSHSRTQSLNNNSPISSRSSSVVLPLPSPQFHGHSRTYSGSFPIPASPNQQTNQLPPISGILGNNIKPVNDNNEDNDATDIEITDDDNDTTT